MFQEDNMSMSARAEKTMAMLMRAIEFDCESSDGLSVELNAPLRRAAFHVRRQHGMPRAVALSLFVHASIGVALFFQLVPQQFMRMQGSGNEQKLLEVFLIAEPAGASGGAPRLVQAIAAAPAAAPEPVVKAEHKPEPIKKTLAEYSMHRKTKALPPEVPVQAEEAPVGKADATAESPQPGQATGSQDSGNQTGAGSGSGAPYDTSFGQADAPRFLNYVQPKYPLAARQQGREGTVVLRLTIDERGNLVQVEVVASPSDGFAQSAVEAVKLSTFAPALRGGKAVSSRAVLPMRFALRH